jgi:hypothetical protein
MHTPAWRRARDQTVNMKPITKTNIIAAMAAGLLVAGALAEAPDPAKPGSPGDKPGSPSQTEPGKAAPEKPAPTEPNSPEKPVKPGSPGEKPAEPAPAK